MLPGLDAPIDALEDYLLALDAQSRNIDDSFTHYKFTIASRY